MLLAAIMGKPRSGPGRFSMRSRTGRHRSRSFLRFRSRVALRLRFGAFLERVGVTRKPPLTGIVRMCSYLHYSRITGGFRASSPIASGSRYKSRLVEDKLASEFVRRGFRMKAMHRLIVTSETYKLASEVDPDSAPASGAADGGTAGLWLSRRRRLEAEPIWDAILFAAGDLDLSLGGPSFDPGGGNRRRGGPRAEPAADTRTNRRAAYMV